MYASAGTGCGCVMHLRGTLDILQLRRRGRQLVSVRAIHAMQPTQLRPLCLPLSPRYEEVGFETSALVVELLETVGGLDEGSVRGA